MKNSSLSRHIPYYPFIDGMRALAVLSVILFHLNSTFMPGGFVGVDVFFVISGFIVSASVSALKGSTTLEFFIAFYSRRIKRIFPALVFMLLMISLISALFIPGSWLSYVNQTTGLYAFFGLSNFILSSTGRDYFAPTTDFNPFTHTWSLGVEEQFYIIFPFLYIFWLSFKRKYISSIIYLVIGVASVIYSFYLSHSSPTQAYYSTVSRFWELSAGVLLFHFMSSFQNVLEKKKWTNWIREAVGYISLLSMLVAFYLTDNGNFPMPGALLATVSTLGLFFGLYQRPDSILAKKILGNSFLRYIGKLSFSLYLWHWPVFVIFRWTCGLETTGQRVAALIITILCSLFSFYLVEKPVRASSFISRKKDWAVLVSGFVLVGVAYYISNTINAHAGNISQSVLLKSPQDWYPEGSGVVDGFPGCNADPEHKEIDGGLLLIYKVKGCVKPTKENPHKVFVIGDSHALAYSSVFKSFAIKTQSEVYAYNNGGCPFLSFTPNRDLDVPACRKYTDASLKDISNKIREGDILFLASLRLPRFVDQWAYFGDAEHKEILFSNQAQQGRSRTIQYAVEALKPIADKGVHIVFEAPKPLFKIPVYRCADWYDKDNPICKGGDNISRGLIESYRAPIMESYVELGKQIPLSVWDPLPELCDEKTCYAYKNHKPLFFDGDHLSGYGNQVLLPSFLHFMKDIERGQQAKGNLNSFSIDFMDALPPEFIDTIEGMSHYEPWGRWSDANESEHVSISFLTSLPKHFIFTIKAHALGPNIGKDITIKYSGVNKTLNLTQNDTVQSLEFNVEDQSKKIEIFIPHPVSPKSLGLGEDLRLLGIGIVNININSVN